MTSPKRHHYLPEFYLNYFTDKNGQFWVYHKDTNKFIIQTPINTAVNSYRYTWVKDKGEKDNKIEELLASIESDTKPLFEKLDSSLVIENEEKYKLAIFIAFQQTRVPFFQKQTDELKDKMMKDIMKLQFNSVERTKSILKELEKQKGENIDVNPEEMYKYIRDDKYSIEFSKEEYLMTMLTLSEKTALYFLQMNWVFIFAPEGTGFIISDNPFNIVPSTDYNQNYGIGIITSGAQKIIPLTSKVLLSIHDKGDLILKVKMNKKQIRTLNIITATNSDKIIVSKNKEQLENILSYLNNIE
jgi:hypothetical protein